MRYKVQAIIFFVIVGLLSITRSFGEMIRFAVQLSSIFFLALMYIEQHGISIKPLQTLPKNIKTFFLVFIIAIAVSSIFSDFQSRNLVYIYRISVFFLIVYLIYSLVDSIDIIRVYLFSLYSSLLILSIALINELVQSGLDILTFSSAAYRRTGGLIPNVNALGGIYAITLPILISLTFIHNYKIRFVSWTLIIISAFASFAVVSRGAILSIFISVLIIFYYFNKKYFYRSILTIVLLVIFILMIEPASEVVEIFFRVEEGLSQRDYLWQMTISMLGQYWLTGTGPGAFGDAMFNHFPMMLGTWPAITITKLYLVTDGSNVAHNFYLALFTEFGVIGLLLSFYLPFIFITIGIKTIKRTKENIIYNHLAVGITAMGIGMFTRAHFDNVNIITNGYITTDLPFWIMFIILLFIYRTTFTDKTNKVNNNFLKNLRE